MDTALRGLLGAAIATLVVASGASAQAATIRKAGKALGEAAEAKAAKKATDRYDPSFQKYTKRYFGVGHDWRLFKAQGMAESDLTPTARSRVGARGIMQLMPSTYQLIKTARPEFRSIDDPEHNIAAGIMHDRYLWTLYPTSPGEERTRFMFAAYNAGEGTIKKARSIAKKESLDDQIWTSVEAVAPKVKPWRYRETLGYVRKIEENRARLKK
ncbi:MAG TPA: transglycosylase SLT domain-containing protein [Gemmatimonadaceae bacterium]|nr:transglycosylase SLT domain-containing protein [Gemmatimonadaceae bacterium]